MVHRALIVDDSRSARMLLKRLLEGFGLEVHAVESGEQALTWLQQDRPDVIFMDHLMPGMDGFAAVKVIKSDPQTANIPVLMYTSQEGALYLSQARALGAMGVLPKTLKSADVADVLRQLNMLKAAPGSAPATSATAANAESPTVIPMALPAGRVEPTLTATRPTEANQLAHRIAMELRAELPLLAMDVSRALRLWRRVALLLGVLLMATLVALWVLQVQLNQLLQQGRVATLPANRLAAPPVVTPPSRVAAAEQSVSAAPAARLSTLLATEPVPYGEVPLAGERLDRLRALVAQQRAKRTTAVIQVQVFQADFCLAGSGNQYQLAPEEWLASRCDLVGNPFGEALSVQQRQSVSFANFVNSINAGRGTLVVDVQDGGQHNLQAYPERSETLTAGQWNAVALRNQRVEFALLSSR